MNDNEKAFAEQIIENQSQQLGTDKVTGEELVDEQVELHHTIADKTLEKCLWKAILQYRKLDYVNCEKCYGYNQSCEYYQKKPDWYEEGI